MKKLLVFMILFFLCILFVKSMNGMKTSIDGIIMLFSIAFVTASGFYFFADHVFQNKDGKKVELETFYMKPDDSTLQKITPKDPEFVADNFLRNVGTLASKLNSAWCNDKMGDVRNLVSSGVYNRFKIQLELMHKSGIKNVMEYWALSSVQLLDVESDSDYQTAHTQIFAYAKDMNVDKNLAAGEIQTLFKEATQNSYSEVWSFVRKKTSQSHKGKSLLEGNCPNCGGLLEGLGESNQCKYCKTIINSGEYDWVLAEITQVEEWNHASSNTIDLAQFKALNPLAARQIIEDRASYIFWRWMETFSVGKKDPLRRDATAGLLNSWVDEKIEYSEVAVGSVDLTDIYTSADDGIYADVFINWSADFNHRESTLSLRLNPKATKTSGLAENSCSNCGAPYPDSDAKNCAYCSHPIPSVLDDWLLSAII